jgi:hypothetical protein
MLNFSSAKAVTARYAGTAGEKEPSLQENPRTAISFDLSARVYMNKN